MKFATVIGLLLLSATARAETYRNDEWGVQFTLPADLSTCVAEHDFHDHGPIIFLDPTESQKCDDPAHRRAISMFNSYNAPAQTLQQLFLGLCSTDHGVPCKQLRGLQLNGYASLAGRLDYPDGRILIAVAAQGGRDAKWFGADKLISYYIALHTDQRHFSKDLSSFRALLKSIILTPPGEASPSSFQR